MPLQIRRARANDLEVVIEFNRRLAWETEGYTLDPVLLRAGVETVLNEQADAHYLVAEADGRVIGQLMLTREWSDWRNGWFYWIQSVYVAAEHRGQGVFRALYAAAVRFVEDQPNAVGLRLYVEHNNHSAQATYARLGMKHAGYLVLEHAVRNALERNASPSGSAG